MKLLLLLLFLILLPGCFSFAQEKSDLPKMDAMIGQMLMAGFRGFEVSDTNHIVRDIQEHKIGGVILFDYDVPRSVAKRNIQNATQVQNLNKNLQKLSAIPLFIAVDQEGGRVTRLKPANGFPETVSAGYLGEVNNADTTKKYADETANLLSQTGFNVNFAPVVDLNTNPENPIIGRLGRSFGADTALVNRHAYIFIRSHLQQNVLPVLKHFPGHGSSRHDTHIGMADVTDTWNSIELEPYRYLLAQNPGAGVMTAHVFNESLDKDYPATLSRHVQTDILRESLGFNGVLFSDDMQMDAIRSYYGLETAIRLAITAGVDILVFANNSVYDPDIIPAAVSIIKNLLEKGEISEEQIRTSYNRITRTKKQLGIL